MTQVNDITGKAKAAAMLVVIPMILCWLTNMISGLYESLSHGAPEPNWLDDGELVVILTSYGLFVAGLISAFAHRAAGFVFRAICYVALILAADSLLTTVLNVNEDGAPYTRLQWTWFVLLTICSSAAFAWILRGIAAGRLPSIRDIPGALRR